MTRYVVVCNSDHSQRKAVVLPNSDVASLKAGLEKTLGKFKGRTVKNSRFFIRDKELDEYSTIDSSVVNFPDDTLVIICGLDEIPVRNTKAAAVTVIVICYYKKLERLADVEIAQNK